MVISRLLSAPVVRLGFRSNGQKFFSTTNKLESGYITSYRQIRYDKIADVHHIIADMCGTFMWWWIFWHLFTEYDHMFGGHEPPDTSLFTDQELGITPDSAPDPEQTITQRKTGF